MAYPAYAATAAVMLFPTALVYAALMDIMTMKIRNLLVLAIAGAYFVLAPVAGFSLSAIGFSVLVALVVFLATFFFFAMGWIGGGDAKLAAATALWFSPSEALVYFVYASLLGGLLTLLILSFRKMPLPGGLYRVEWIARLHDPKSGIPYGAAMAPAALLVFPQTAWFAAAA